MKQSSVVSLITVVSQIVVSLQEAHPCELTTEN
jgi:hypothetical protein